MYSFIPSWYGDKEDWKGSISPWHEAGHSYEFDDTVNHLRMFRNAGEETEILCLGWSPRLRRFLHRQNLYPISYWSVFDELQGITLKKPAVFSYQELSWPEDVEWVYLSTHLAAYIGNQHYADVEFAGDGTLCRVDYYTDGGLARRDIYDDRGFCSASTFYQRGIALRQEYYDQNGRLRFTWQYGTGESVANETAADEAVSNRSAAGLTGAGCIHIAKEAVVDFARLEYDSMEDLIGERLSHYLTAHPDREALVIAADPQHNALIRRVLEQVPADSALVEPISRKSISRKIPAAKVLPRQRVVLSFFEDRFNLQDQKAILEATENASLIVTDTEHAARQIQGAWVKDIPICDISPFDVRLPLGESQRIRELRIFMPLDGLEDVLLEKALHQVYAYMQTNPDVVLLAGTRASSVAEQEQLLEKLDEIMLSMGEPERSTSFAERIRVTPYYSEMDLIRILRDARLILDVRDQPELYLQIAGISAGIPQVNYRFTRYVKHKKNGYIIQNINYITGALEYYLDGLSGWNEALVYCVQEVSRYTGGTLVQRWKTMLGADVKA